MRGPLLSGRIAPEHQATVRAEVGGPVLSVEAEPGEPVRRGKVLARIDAAALQEQRISARSAVASAKVALTVAQREAKRLDALVQAGAVSQQELESARRNVTAARAQVADAEARLALAEEQLARTAVRSPMTGIVSERPVNAGDVVQPGAALFTIVDPSSMRMEGWIPATEFTDVKVGHPVQFEVTGYTDRMFDGRVSRINPTADPSTGQVRLTVSIPNAGRTLAGGLLARGRIGVERASGLLVPAAALREQEGRQTATAVRGGKAAHIPVSIGVQDPLTETVHIRSGLNEGEVVLLGGAQALSDGTPVQLPEPEPAARESATAQDGPAR